MKNKTDLQTSELDAVSGGMQDEDIYVTVCKNCGEEYSSRAQYPDGFLVDVSGGCSPKCSYKCPHCNYTWTN